MNSLGGAAEFGKTMRRGHGFRRLPECPGRGTPKATMKPSPQEEGFGPRVGSVDIRNALLIPRDPRGIVLACGFVSLAALGIDVLIAAGDWIGFAFLIAAVYGYLFIRTRLSPILVWLLVAAYGAFGATGGNASDWLVVGLGALLAVVGVFPPVDWTEEPTSRKLEVGPTAARPTMRPEAAGGGETSRTLEVSAVAGPNGSRSEIEPKAGLSLGEPEPNGSRRASLRTIGTLQLELDGRDRMQRIREQPRLEFLLDYLIARRVLTFGGLEERPAVAAEIAPGNDPSTQLNRLRKTLHALGDALGPDLKSLVHKTPTHIRLDFKEIDVDFLSLSELAARLERGRGLVDATLADEIRRLLETTAGEFLAGFSELEQQVTEGRGSAAGVVEEARLKVNGWRADLVVALARHFDAADRAQSSLAYLQSALTQSPEREDVARLLVATYMQTGQIARADELRRAYNFSLGEVR